MNITKEQFKNIVKKYSTLLVLEDDVEAAFDFVRDVLEAEADAIKAAEPYATNTIDRYECAAYEVGEVCREVTNEEFSEAG